MQITNNGPGYTDEYSYASVRTQLLTLPHSLTHYYPQLTSQMSSTSLPSIRLGAYLYTTLHFIRMIKRASTSFSCAKAMWHHKIFLFIVWPIESINCSFLCFLHYPLQRLPLHMVFLPACLCPCHAHTIELSLGICSL